MAIVITFQQDSGSAATINISNDGEAALTAFMNQQVVYNPSNPSAPTPVYSSLFQMLFTVLQSYLLTQVLPNVAAAPSPPSGVQAIVTANAQVATDQAVVQTAVGTFMGNAITHS